MKKLNSFKECVIQTANGLTYTQYFNIDWTYQLIESYMLENCHIDKDSIIEVRISSITIYKNSTTNGNTTKSC